MVAEVAVVAEDEGAVVGRTEAGYVPYDVVVKASTAPIEVTKPFMYWYATGMACLRIPTVIQRGADGKGTGSHAEVCSIACFVHSKQASHDEIALCLSLRPVLCSSDRSVADSAFIE